MCAGLGNLWKQHSRRASAISLAENSHICGCGVSAKVLRCKCPEGSQDLVAAKNFEPCRALRAPTRVSSARPNFEHPAYPPRPGHERNFEHPRIFGKQKFCQLHLASRRLEKSTFRNAKTPGPGPGFVHNPSLHPYAIRPTTMPRNVPSTCFGHVTVTRATLSSRGFPPTSQLHFSITCHMSNME